MIVNWLGLGLYKDSGSRTVRNCSSGAHGPAMLSLLGAAFFLLHFIYGDSLNEFG